MDIKRLAEKAFGIVKKYKYAAILVLIGVLLMTLPSLTENEEEGKEYVQATHDSEIDICKQITDILANVKGVGDVDVMVAVASGEETIYQTDDRITQGNDNAVTQRDTIIITDAQRTQTGLVKQVNTATYKGAIVVCEGADSPAVRLAVIDAVSKVTGLSSDKISVLKMK